MVQLFPAPVWQARRVVVAIGLVLASSIGVWYGLHERRQETISYRDFARTLPRHGWFHITGARIDLEHPITTLSARGGSSYLIAVYAADDVAHKEPSALVLSTSIKPVSAGDTVDGVLLTNAFDRPDHYDTDRERFGARLAPDARVLLLDGKPDLTLFLILLIVGLLLAAILAIDLIGAVALRADRRRSTS